MAGLSMAEDTQLDNRVRMCEELLRGQAQQMDFLVKSDTRRTEISQQSAVDMARMADALSSVGEKANSNRELIMANIDSKTVLLEMKANAHDERLSKHERDVTERFDGVDKRVDAHDSDLLSHNRYWKNALWVLGSLFLVGTGILSAIIQHMIAAPNIIGAPK